MRREAEAPAPNLLELYTHYIQRLSDVLTKELPEKMKAEEIKTQAKYKPQGRMGVGRDVCGGLRKGREAGQSLQGWGRGGGHAHHGGALRLKAGHVMAQDWAPVQERTSTSCPRAWNCPHARSQAGQGQWKGPSTWSRAPQTAAGGLPRPCWPKAVSSKADVSPCTASGGPKPGDREGAQPSPVSQALRSLMSFPQGLSGAGE